MTESDRVADLKRLCEGIAEQGVLASQPDIPKLFAHLGAVIESHQREICLLQSSMEKLERELKSIDAKTGFQ